MYNKLVRIEEPRKVNIDVAGGKGEFLSKKAKENPGQTFVVLDPGVYGSEYAPHLNPELKNLHIINWKSDIDSHLPLAKESVDEANANFLMGEIYTKEGSSKTVEEDKAKYARVMRDIFAVLKNEGKLRIVDLQAVIPYIVEVLNDVGFTITLTPSPLPIEEKDMSEWSTAFFNMYETTGKNPASLVLPMVVEAVKRELPH